MNNEKIMREKAEQMAKKAEAKLEQINEKARKYQERKIENFDNWNKNSKNKNLDENSNLNTNKRDYDKDPLVLKSYSRLFSSIANGSTFYLSLYLFSILATFIRDKNFEEPFAYIYTSILMALILILGNFLKYHLTCIKEKTFIVFKNSKIEYLTNGKLKFFVGLEKVLIQGKSLTGSFTSFQPIWLIFFCSIFFICIYMLPSFIIFPLFLLLGHIIYKVVWWLVINKSLKNFRLFNCINVLICEFYDNKAGMNFFMFEDKYGLIHTFNEKDYSDLREYFLTTKNINIDYIQKSYKLI